MMIIDTPVEQSWPHPFEKHRVAILAGQIGYHGRPAIKSNDHNLKFLAANISSALTQGI